MGFNPFDVITKPIQWVAGGLSGETESNERLDEYNRQIAEERRKAKQAQLDLLGGMKRPEYSQQHLARIKALEDESQAGPLSQDPLFQADRAALVQGGQQALSSVQNQQRAMGTAGGFSNQGSMADVYDRLGAQLADLGQKSRAVKEQKRDVAAQARQEMVDAQIEYDNAVTKAKMAIESGDSEAASAALTNAFNARQAILDKRNQMAAALIQGGVSAYAAANGAPPPQGGASGGGGGQGFQSPKIDAPKANYAANIPYAAMKGRRSYG